MDASPLDALLLETDAAAVALTDIQPLLPEDDDPLHALVAELRNYQHELELQNEVLNYSQAVAESASERFETLFASIPLPLLVIDDFDMIVQANAMAQKAFQPSEKDRLLINFSKFVNAEDAQRVTEAFTQAQAMGRAEVHEVAFYISEFSELRGDLHVAAVAVPQQNQPANWQYLCAVVNQGPLLAERHALRAANGQRALRAHPLKNGRHLCLALHPLRDLRLLRQRGFLRRRQQAVVLEQPVGEQLEAGKRQPPRPFRA